MKLLLVGTYPRDQQYSLIGFARALREGCEEAGIETRLIAPQAIVGLVGQASHGFGKWLGHFDKLVLFPLTLRRQLEWADVVHLVDHGLAPYIKHLQGVPHLVTCNDLIAMRASLGELPEWHTSGTAAIFQQKIRQGLSGAQHIVCISEATRSDVCRLSDVSQERTTVVYDSLFYPYTPMVEEERRPILRDLGIADASFVFHIGRNAPTKNRIGVIRIFAALRQRPKGADLHLVLAGKALSEEMRAIIREEKLDSVVHELVGLQDEQLRALYSSAKAMIFPSFYEGFGMPIIEAQACGCPVFTSNRAPMTEVGGDAACYFDPVNSEEAAKIIAQELETSNLSKMTERGFENVKRFQHERMIKEYIEVYKRVLETGSQG